MARNYRQRNPVKKGAKKPPEIYHAIALQYCKGMSQSRTTEVVSRWAKINDLPTVTRQTVAKHYASLGDKLFHLAYIDKYGPRDELICDECRNREVKIYLDYLYADAEKFKDDRDWWQDRFWWVNAHKMNSLNDKYYQSVTYDDFVEISKNVNGFFEKTFYIHWSRVYWLRKFRADFPKETKRQLVGRLFTKTFEELSLPKGTRCHADDYEIDSYQYYTNGAYYVRLSLAQIEDFNEKTPVLAEVFGEKTKLKIDNELIFLICTDCTGKWVSITEQVFNKMLAQSGAGILDS
ncbi:MAG: hypothetical protein KZQ85_08770 [Candidatus Thiodiazotropha sp. (ex Myrtea sp. 'scaly one' KF741663)]|nr:hypothetical protein [Candidatus Thiodiazotropha sp. (ex Myrtea sp. 'scaly one' KF741663)]